MNFNKLPQGRILPTLHPVQPLAIPSTSQVRLLPLQRPHWYLICPPCWYTVCTPPTGPLCDHASSKSLHRASPIDTNSDRGYNITLRNPGLDWHYWYAKGMYFLFWWQRSGPVAHEHWWAQSHTDWRKVSVFPQHPNSTSSSAPKKQIKQLKDKKKQKTKNTTNKNKKPTTTKNKKTKPNQKTTKKTTINS